MGKKMSNAPVYFALAQARFNSVANIGKYVNEIQDTLRLKGYTIFGHHKITELGFNESSGKNPEPVVVQTSKWLFNLSDKKSGFVLDSNSLTYHTTHYETSSEFISGLLSGLEAVHKVVDLAYLTRLGLRYLDAVLPKEGESVSLYLVNELHGVSLSKVQKSSLHESVFETKTEPMIDDGTLIARVYRMTSSLAYPPDIDPSGLVPMERFVINKEIPHAVIDTDHFVQGRMPLDLQQMKLQLESLHLVLNEAFEKMTTAHAKTAWK